MRNDTLVMKSYMANVESKMSNYCTIWDTPTQAQIETQKENIPINWIHTDSSGKYPQYTGLDVSPCVIEKVKKQFANDKSKVFYEVGEFLENPSSAELGLSLDVIYHLVNDEIFESYMYNLFTYAQKFVIIYSSNKDQPHTQPRAT